MQTVDRGWEVEPRLMLIGVHPVVATAWSTPLTSGLCRWPVPLRSVNYGQSFAAAFRLPGFLVSSHNAPAAIKLAKTPCYLSFSSSSPSRCWSSSFVRFFLDSCVHSLACPLGRHSYRNGVIGPDIAFQYNYN